MAFGDDLLAFLDAGSTKITAGTNAFKNAVTETTGRAVFVIETPGLPAIEKFGGELPAITRPRAQIMVRSTKAVGGSGIAGSTGTRILAQDMWELCVGVTDENMNSIRYLRCEPLQDPFSLGHDEAGRAMFAFNVQAMRTPTTQAG